jgi:hypothetical protein
MLTTVPINGDGTTQTGSARLPLNEQGSSLRVTAGAGHGIDVTPSQNYLDASQKPCNAISVSANDTTVTGVLSGGATMTTDPLPKGMLHCFEFTKITSVSGGNCKAWWHVKP